jgi:hypothetical protein
LVTTQLERLRKFGKSVTPSSGRLRKQIAPHLVLGYENG